MKAFDAFEQKRNVIALFPDQAIGTLHHAGARDEAKNLFGIDAGEGVARDFFPAFHAFEQERVARTLRNAEIGADGGKQVRGKNIVDRDEIALLGETLEFAEIGADHEELRERLSLRKAVRTARRIG